MSKKGKTLSLLMGASLLCFATAISKPAIAGTLTVKGNTQVNMYGFAYTEFSWYNQTAGDPDHYNMPIPDATKSDSLLYQKTYDKIKSYAYSLKTRVGFYFKNKDSNIIGRIEGDFKSGSNFRLRRAYVRHNFKGFYVLVGQEWILEDMIPTVGAADSFPAGFNNTVRVPQVQIGTNINLESASLKIAFAFEYASSKNVKEGNASKYSQQMYVNRTTVPYPAARVILNFDTSFGSPAEIYTWGALIPVHVTTADGTSSVDNSKTSYAFGAGIKVPISIVTIGLNYNYTDGATGYAGLSNYSPASYYFKDGSIKRTASNAYNINAVVSLTPTISIGAEYDYVEFKNDDAFNGSKPKVETYLGNININTTRLTKLTIEARHIKAKDFDVIKDVKDDNFKGYQLYAIYKYAF